MFHRVFISHNITVPVSYLKACYNMVPVLIPGFYKACWYHMIVSAFLTDFLFLCENNLTSVYTSEKNCNCSSLIRNGIASLYFGMYYFMKTINKNNAIPLNEPRHVISNNVAF